jgi:hypothetical protein
MQNQLKKSVRFECQTISENIQKLKQEKFKTLNFCFQIQGHSRTFKFCTNAVFTVFPCLFLCIFLTISLFPASFSIVIFHAFLLFFRRVHLAFSLSYDSDWQCISIFDTSISIQVYKLHCTSCQSESSNFFLYIIITRNIHIPSRNIHIQTTVV